MKYSKAYKKKTYIVAILLTILFTYLGGFVSGVKKYFPYDPIKKYYYNYSDFMLNTGNLQKCTIPRLTILPDKFSVIIGHAYGAIMNGSSNDFIANSISEFIIKNRNNIEKLIVTGDVFWIPSKQKWERLFQDFGSIDVHIAPGNHDIGRPDSMDVFKASNFIRQDYPYKVKISDTSVVLDDSVFSNWITGSEVTKKIVESQSQTIIVARHHILITELLKFANSRETPVSLPSVEKFTKNFPRHKTLTWIMGDGGGLERFPRITCRSFENHRFIVNGIGEIEGDTVLILHEGKIFSHVI